MPRKASDKSQLCGCIVCGFVDWIGGKYGSRPEHQSHLWFKENGHDTSYGCLDCYNLYNARRTASTKADRTGTSSDCLCPDTRSGYFVSTKELFKDVDPTRVSTPTKTGSKSSTKASARDALAIHDAILSSTETINGNELLDKDDHVCPPTDDESSSSSSSSSSDSEDGVLTQSPDLFPSKSSSVSFSKSKEKEKQKEKEKKKEEEKEREKEHEKKRKSSLKMSTNSLPYEPMPHGLYVKPNSNKQRKLV